MSVNMSKIYKIYKVFCDYDNYYLHVSDVRKLSGLEERGNYINILVNSFHRLGLITSVGNVSNNMRYKILDYDFNNWRNATARYKKMLNKEKWKSEKL